MLDFYFLKGYNPPVKAMMAKVRDKDSMLAEYCGKCFFNNQLCCNIKVWER